MILNRHLLLTACFFAILAGIIVLRSMQVKSSHTANESASGSVRTTKPFTSAGRASQGNPSSRNAHASKTDDRLIQVPREVRKRILASYNHSLIEGDIWNPTWSKDCLVLLGLDEGQQERLQEALDQAYARAFEVMKRKVKLVEEDNKTGVKTFEIPDWSKGEGVALRAEMTKALESEVSAADAAILMNMISLRSYRPNATGPVLFGEGRLNMDVHMENGEWRIKQRFTHANAKSQTMISTIQDLRMSELPKEWLELFNLSNPGKW